MNLNRIVKLASENPRVLFHYLRDTDLETRVAAFDAFLELEIEDPGIIKPILPDVLSIIIFEVIPSLADETEAEECEALSNIVIGLAVLGSKLATPELLLPLFGPLKPLTSHADARIRSAAIAGLGILVRNMPDEITDEIVSLLMPGFKDDEPRVRISCAFAWGNIACSNPKAATIAVGRCSGLLTDRIDRVRAEAVGFFISMGHGDPESCKTVLPLLREIRENDENQDVRKRASTAVLAITG